MDFRPLPVLVVVSGDGLGFLLNVLKLLGLLIGAVATAIATLTETKTPDRLHLTRPGKWILGIGLAGAIIAATAQGVEWYSTNLKDAQASARERELSEENHQLLVEIGRSVTRLSDISMDVSVTLDTEQPEVQEYIDELQRRLARLANEPNPLGKTLYGLQVVTRIGGRHPVNETVRMPPGSDAFPDPRVEKSAQALLNLTLPTVAVFRKPIDLQSDVALYPFLGHPDLLVFPTGGNLEGFFHDRRSGGIIGFDLRLARSQANIPFSASIGMESIKDLNGAQVVVCYSFQTPNERLMAGHSPGIALIVNHHKIQLNLTPVLTLYHHTVYVATLPNIIP